VFRKSTPYTFPGGTSLIVNKNNARLVEVWLDEWKEFYYNINPGNQIIQVNSFNNNSFLCLNNSSLFIQSLKLSLMILKAREKRRLAMFRDVWSCERN
jgi:hypothetical protein